MPSTTTPNAAAIIREIHEFTAQSPLNYIPEADNTVVFEPPQVGFADGADPIFREFKTRVGPRHITPDAALAGATGESPAELPPVCVIAWTLTHSVEIRAANRRRKRDTSRLAALARTRGGAFNNALRDHIAAWLKESGYRAAAPARQAYFNADDHTEGNYSNWSERYVAHAAGLGSFGVSGSFITPIGIAARCGSVVTDLALPPTPRNLDLHAGCLFYADGSCLKCVRRCPAGAISETGRSKGICRPYCLTRYPRLRRLYGVPTPGCNLCQVAVPCEATDPVRAASLAKRRK
jgi:epoxyqueuosine reductase